MSLLSPIPVARGQCTPTWLELGGLPGFDGPCNTMLSFDDGSGARLYAGGAFGIAGGETTLNVARFDGARWSAMGDGFNGAVSCLAAFGGQVYAGGAFTLSGTTSVKRVARWNGSAWEPVGPGFDNGSVLALQEHDGALYAAGAFTTSGGVASLRVARWTGSVWQQVGGGFADGAVNCLAAFQGQLYAGGTFSASGATTTSNIARFDGTAWQPLAAGVGGGSSVRGVWSMTVMNNELHAAGGFTSVDGASCYYAARWNGAAWTPMSFPAGSSSNGARTLMPFGGTLYCGGTFGVTGGIYFARWNGSAWVNAGATFNTPSGVLSLAVFNNELYLGGSFTRVNANAFNRITRYNGSDYSQVGSGFDNRVEAIAQFEGGLVIGGSFISAGGLPALHVVRFDGEQYTPMGQDLAGDGSAFHTTDFCVLNGELHACGAWTVGGSTKRVVRWSGTAWVPLAAQPGGTPNCIGSYQGNLVVGGLAIGGAGVNVLRHNGTAWVPMGNGLNNEVFDLMEFGGGLYACGAFSASGSTPMSFVARWDGSSWNAVGGSIAPPGISEAGRSLVEFNNQIVVGGNIPSLAGVAVNGIARLNGTAWTPFAAGFTSGNVSTIAVLDGNLIAGGSVRPPGTAAATYVSLWNGLTWTPIGQNFSGYVAGGAAGSSLATAAVFQNELFIGGDFYKAGGRVSSFLAHWGSEPPCVQTQPGETIGCPNGAASLRVFATGVPSLNCQWRRQGTPLLDGVTPGGSTVAGANTPVLSVSGLSAYDDATYDVVISNSFGSATSNAAHLIVTCCPDFNEDGNADQDDIAYLVNVIAGGPNPSGRDPDFTGDGNVDQDDYIALVNVVAGGPCP